MSVTLVDIVDRFEQESASELNCGIASFKFGWLSELVNADKKASYPMALLQPPDGIIPELELTEDNQSYILYLFDNHNCNDGKDKARIWTELNHMGVKLLRRVCSDDDYAIIGSVPYFLDSSMHNDKLLGVRFEFTMRATNECGLGCCIVYDEFGTPVVEGTTGDNVYVDCDNIIPPFVWQFDVDILSSVNTEPFSLTSTSGQWAYNLGDGTGDQLSILNQTINPLTYAIDGVKTVGVTLVDGADTVTDIEFVSQYLTGSFDLSSFTGLVTLDINGNTETVTTVVMPNKAINSVAIVENKLTSGDGTGVIVDFTNFNTDLNNQIIVLQDNGWLPNQVDQVLIDLNAISNSGFTGRDIDLSGLNDSPTAAGLAAKSNLETKGFTVTTN